MRVRMALLGALAIVFKEQWRQASVLLCMYSYSTHHNSRSSSHLALSRRALRLSWPRKCLSDSIETRRCRRDDSPVRSGGYLEARE